MASREHERLRPLLGEIHRYFGVLRSPADLPADKKGMWFEQSHATDTHIRDHFSHAIADAGSIDWDLDALSRKEQTGLVVLLDQFPRNVFRGSPDAFAYDDKARSIARQLVKGEFQR